MGHISTHAIRTWTKNHDLQVFVETGTYLGAGLAYARQCNYFNEFHSIEINKEFFDECSHMFSKDDRVTIWHGASDERLPDILSLPSIKEKNILFWLDAHLPSGYKSWENGTETQEQVAPLEQELKIIRKMRPDNKDFIIVDDLRLYAKDDYEYGNSDKRCTENLDWAKHLMGDAFELLKSLKDQGYLILAPKACYNEYLPDPAKCV